MSHISNLKDYIAKDEIYQKYKKDGYTSDMSDFDKFCIGHCEDIEAVLETNNKKRGESETMIKFYYNEKDFTKNDGVKLSDERIQDMIDEVIKGLAEPGDYSFSATGDTIVIGFRWEEEMSIFICKNYEHAEAWVNENGDWEKMDWSIDYEEEERNDYRKLSKEELIDILMAKNELKPVYNPRKEV